MAKDQESSEGGREEAIQIIPHTEQAVPHPVEVPSTLDKKLAKFLKKERGEMTFAQFSKKIGLPPSTIHRLENGEQSITLGRLQQIMDRLKCDLLDVFREEGT